MTLLATAEHFAGTPDWTWYILFYFLLAGLAGGSYFLATLLRHWGGSPADEATARLGFYVAFPAVVVGALLLTLDLKQPLRFWHMMVNTTPGDRGLILNARTPMSVGVWALVVASLFAVVSFLDALVRDGKIRFGLARRLSAVLDGAAGKVWNVVGAIVFVFIAGYTGVLLAVSNQPVWSDTWALGGLFLASGLAGSAALLYLLTGYRRGAEPARGFLEVSERLFVALELLLLVVFVLTLIGDGTLSTTFAFPWVLLWVVALVAMLPSLASLAADRLRVTHDGAGAQHTAAWTASIATPALVLIGVLALRAAVIFSGQG